MRADRLEISLMGPPRIERDAVRLRLPRSRKVLGLLTYLALELAPRSRSRLCDLFWDGVNDPRGELRWCLAKLRHLLDGGERRRVVTSSDGLVSLDLLGVRLDVRTLDEQLRHVKTASCEQLKAALDLCRGDLLEGIEFDGTAEFETWLTGRRQTVREQRVALTRELALRPAASIGDARKQIENWLALEPFDLRAHSALLNLFAKTRRVRDADEHLRRAIPIFVKAGFDVSPLRESWKIALSHPVDPAPVAADLKRARDGLAATTDCGLSRVLAGDPSALGDRQRRRTRPRASVAIMPFVDATSLLRGQALAQGLSDDVITRLSKLRMLRVIARGTMCTLFEHGFDTGAVAATLGVDYVVSGCVRQREQVLTVSIELIEARDASIIWADEFCCSGDQVFAALDAIVDRIVAAIDAEVEITECQRAMARPLPELDAWEVYHRALWHMYRFRKADNQAAQQLFQRALELDPNFARAYAGLSFTHFQNVFLDLVPNRAEQVELAFETAAQSLISDNRDPAAHWAMGRALWLRGAQHEAAFELRRSIDLSPNFALGHYTVGFIEAQSGDPHAAIRASDTALRLSPFDPLQFGMLGSRALAHLRLREIEEATAWALRASMQPNAHAHILAIAVVTLATSDRRSEARALLGRIRERVAGYDLERFLRAFRFDDDAERLLRQAARIIAW